MEFIVDQMLGRLTTWLRLLGHDTVSASDFALESKEDEFLIQFAGHKRILVTRDKILGSMAERAGVRVCLINSDSIMEQLEEMSSNYDIDLEPKMTRCTICNALTRKIRSNELGMLKKEDYIPEDLVEDGIDFWICDSCGKVYWEGSHWDDIHKRLEKLREMVASKVSLTKNF
ncbi:MAG: Mut7-C RNAse domain-containing protein [Methanocellales archaeon]|nr:Mut7-C RNAse domain-containing protein [Methanocellales archaeon]